MFTGKDDREGGDIEAGRGGLGSRHLNSKDRQRKVVFRPHPGYQKGEAQITRDTCMGCRDAAVRTTVRELLGQKRLGRVTSQMVICMRGT